MGEAVGPGPFADPGDEIAGMNVEQAGELYNFRFCETARARYGLRERYMVYRDGGGDMAPGEELSFAIDIGR